MRFAGSPQAAALPHGELYTDGDETLFDVVRPVILNGIEDFVTRPDLADRAVFLTLESIADDEKRRTEEEIRAAGSPPAQPSSALPSTLWWSAFADCWR